MIISDAESGESEESSMPIRAIICCTMLFASTPVSANEILGFRIGSTLDEARIAARQIRRELQEVNLGGDPAMQMFVVSQSGPQIGFCRGRLIMLQMDMSGSFHEFVNTFEKNRRDFGEPRSRPSQTYAGGMQLSSLNLEWPKPDGVLATLSMWNIGSEKLMTTYGLFQPNACSEAKR